jgi:putative transcriptional regulator
MSKFFKDLKAGLEEAIEYRKGNVKLRSSTYNILQPPSKYQAKDIKKIRQRHKYSQAYFAKMLNVSVRTIESWENGKRSPSQAALRLLELIDKNIYKPQ